MINYYDEMENVSDDYLKYINSHLKWFKEINRNERFNRIDFTAIDKKERTVSIETKIRMNNIFTYKSTYIEVDKYNNLIEDFKKTGHLPLFLNFYQNKEHFAIWRLDKMKKLEKITVKIFNPGSQKHEIVERYLLPNFLSSYYEYDEVNKKYIKKW